MSVKPDFTPAVIGSIEVGGRRFNIVRTAFSNGRLALLLDREGMPYSRLAVNIPDADIPDDVFFARTYEENAQLRAPLLATGLFEDTGMRAQSGFVELEVWRLLPRVLH